MEAQPGRLVQQDARMWRVGRTCTDCVLVELHTALCAHSERMLWRRQARVGTRDVPRGTDTKVNGRPAAAVRRLAADPMAADPMAADLLADDAMAADAMAADAMVADALAADALAADAMAADALAAAGLATAAAELAQAELGPVRSVPSSLRGRQSVGLA
jgi:pentapeptide MXKDX repeat protein